MKSNRPTILLLSCLAMFCLIPPAVSRAEPLAYISNYLDNTVSVIHVPTDTVVDRFPSLPDGDLGPWGVAVRPGGQEVYLSQPYFRPFAGGDPVAVIGTSADHPTQDVAVGRGALGIAFDPSGRKVYQANAEDGSITVIRTGNKTTTTLDLGLNYPFGVAAASVNGRVRLYVSENGGNTVAVVDPAQGIVMWRISVGRSPAGIAVNPSGTRVYAANYRDHTLSVINTATNRVIRTAAVGYNPFGVAVSPSGSRVYVANQTKWTGRLAASGTVSVIDTKTNTETARVRVGPSPSGIAVTPDGAKVYVANTGGNTVSVIAANLSKPKVVKTIKVGAGPVAFGAFISAAGAGRSGVNLEEVRITDDLLVKEASVCQANTLCVTVDWAKATEVEGVHKRHLRLAAKVGDEWRLLWEKVESGPFNEAGVSTPIPLSEDEADWLYWADKAVLAATQVDAQAESQGPRVLAASRELRTDLDKDTAALRIIAGADLSQAMLAGAVLSGLDLSGTPFPGANLQCADLSHANLMGAGVAGADFSGTNMSGTTWLDGQQCLDPSPDGCDLPVPEGWDCGGTFIGLSNNTFIPINCKQKCDKGDHDPCEATVEINKSREFYGYISVREEDYDISMSCNPIKPIIHRFDVKAQRPAGTSWIEIEVLGRTYRLKTGTDNKSMTFDIDWPNGMRFVMTRWKTTYSRLCYTQWGLSVATPPFSPEHLRCAPGGVSGSVLLSWSAPIQQPDAPVKQYNIALQDVDDPTVIPRTGGSTEEYLYTGLKAGESYTFNIAARNSVGWSAYSESCTVKLAE